MKIIIVEGTDNTGKDTLIHKLCEQWNNVLLIHCVAPPKDYNEAQQNTYQDALFYRYADEIVERKCNDCADVVIFNRAWYGEYVYGTSYRNRTKDSVMNMIEIIEEKLENSHDDIYYIQLVCDSYNLLKKNDDGKSISNKVDDIVNETVLFKKIFYESKMNKLLVKVNDNDEFRNVNDIYQEVYNFINE